MTVARNLPRDLAACAFEVEQVSRRNARRRSRANGGASGDQDRPASPDPAAAEEFLAAQNGVRASAPLRSPQAFWEFKQRLGVGEDGGLGPASETQATNGESLSNVASLEDDRALSNTAERLAGFVGYCDAVMHGIQRGKRLLEDLESKHHSVSEKTSSLHETCKRLLEEQLRIDTIVKEIEGPLEYLQELDRIGPLLGLPLHSRLHAVDKNATSQLNQRKDDEGNVRALHPDSPEFFGLLKRLDECIEFVEAHPEYKDYEEYSNKFLQLHLRGLSLVRNLVVDSLHTTTTSARVGLETKREQLRRNLTAINDKQQQAEGSRVMAEFDSEINSLLFLRFRSQAAHLRPYINELEIRVSQKDASDLLYTCHKSFCAMRAELLGFIVPYSNELVLQGDLQQTLRVACPYLLTVSRNEFKLFQDFFDLQATEVVRHGGLADDVNGTNQVSQVGKRRDAGGSLAIGSREAFFDMMSEICGTLYNLVRPLIVQLNDFKTLCEAVRTIEGDIIEGSVEVLGEAGRALHHVLVQILRDVQERLIFSTSRYINDNIGGFEAGAQDLNYPQILLDLAKKASGPSSKRQGILAGCYPVLDNTLQCLIWVYRCVEPQTFEELAQEAVVSCSHALKVASTSISAKSAFDGDLFFIKHLLVLREQISPFNTQLTVRQLELDFGTTVQAFGDFLAHTRNIFSRHNNAIVDLVSHGVPTVRVSEIDSKRDLETQLKQACESFIVRTYEHCLAPIIKFLQQVARIVETSQVFQDQAFTKPDKVYAILTNAVDFVPKSLGEIRNKMSLYLANPQTESILFNPIRANVFSALTEMSNCVEANYAQAQVAPMLRALATLRSNVSALVPSHSSPQALEPKVENKREASQSGPVEEGGASAAPAAEEEHAQVPSQDS